MKTLESIFDIKWNPRVLIEASAGTGKTYTIVGLYVRLLAEKHLGVDQILVMTFTKKATAELRDRIFTRLQECLAVLEAPSQQPAEPFLAEFAEKFAGDQDAAETILKAIRNFDENQVTTIHGFCQKVLSEEALSAGTPFEVEVARQDELLTRAAEDYWRTFVFENSNTEAGRYLISKLMDLADTPDALKKLTGPLLSKPYAHIEGERMENSKSYLADVIALREKLKTCWFSEKQDITDILKTCLHSSYQRHLPGRVSKLESFLQDQKYSEDQPDSLRFFTTDYLFSNDHLSKANKDKFPENHRFFELCTEYQKLTEDIDYVKNTLFYDSARRIKEIRDDLSELSGTVTYDDMLINVKKALENPQTGKQLAQSLANKYPFALVDEFQDTDPVQYRIFQKIYDEKTSSTSSLCMIGDPKQAIYAFRGADVYTYLKAREEAGEAVFTLEKNFRSTPNIIRAVNELFNGDQQPFLERDIQYFESMPGSVDEKAPFLMDGKPADKLQITIKDGFVENKPPAREFALEHTVKEVVRFIKLGNEKRALINNNPLRAGDIAILVNTHGQAADIKKRLKDHGVDSVTYSKQKVFGTFDADRIEMVLSAILNPHDQRCINSALMTGFFGYDLSKLVDLNENEEQRLLLIQELQELHDIWQKDGFYPMFRRLIVDSGRLENLAEYHQAERSITNLYQIAEICAEVERSEELDPHSLYTWFRREKADPGEDDENTLMLESDQNLVKISTIHNSKGLQYPVVFCPYLWDYKDNNIKQRKTFEYHDEATHEYRIHINQKKDEFYQLARQRTIFESIAEDVRKTYVALTRAQYYIGLCWVNHKQSNLSGFGALLEGKKDTESAIENGVSIKESGDRDPIYYQELMQKCAKNSNDAIVMHIADKPQESEEVDSGSSEEADNKFEARSYLGPDKVSVRQVVSSFSSINRHRGVDVYEPDYDQVMESYAGAFEIQAEEPQKRTVFTFPRGATAGTAIHKLFEDNEFSFRDTLKKDYTNMIENVLMRYGFEKEWAPVAETMLKNVVHSRIPGLELSKVDEEDQIREMEFLFSSNRAEADELYSIIRDESKVGPRKADATDFMTGFIDLTVRQNGKYFIVDYKSNHLGDHPEDYSAGNLKGEIEANGYDLQYHIYTLALVRYLEKRLPAFDYETHFGGVAYLFVRGNRAGESNGVWFHKPKRYVIQKLGEYLGGSI
jgi:exodeoxyribonuclease V beta subunit